MFTGLVQGIGRIERVERLPDDGGVRISVDAADVPGFAARVGDSIAINGACMTATTVSGTRFTADVSRESLRSTVGLDAVGAVNIETSMRLGDAIGGHLVTGHIDGIGVVVQLKPVGESRELVIRAPNGLARFVARKGSIAVNGVSLTVNEVADTADGCDFSLNLIPHTSAVTTLGRLAPGHSVNLEVDLIARYVERMLPRTA
jgi:riboflavin synthase